MYWTNNLISLGLCLIYPLPLHNRMLKHSFSAGRAAAGVLLPVAVFVLLPIIVFAVPACNGSTFDAFSLPPAPLDGQDGWVFTGAYDVEIVENIDAFPSFGCQSLRISDALTSGSFGDWVFSKPIVNEAGETDALNDGMSGGSREKHFEAQFDIASATPDVEQAGLRVSISPDRGDGARMSFLRFNDMSDGIHVFFDDFQDAAPFGAGIGDILNGCDMTPVTGEDGFVETDIATLDRTLPHTIKFVMDFVDGPRNDVVQIYVDGVLVHTGGSWEDYFRFCEGNPTRTVDSLIIQSRTGGGPLTNPANAGKGFLLDNFTLSSGVASSSSASSVSSSSSVSSVTSSSLSSVAPSSSSLTSSSVSSVTPSSSSSSLSSLSSAAPSSLSSSSSSVSSAPGLTCNGLPATIVGTSGSEILQGTNGNDVILARGGNDIINARGGNDTVCAGDGNDIVNADGGNDWVDGGMGKNILNGGGGMDTLLGGTNDDVLNGGADNDTMNGAAGFDICNQNGGTGTETSCEL